MSENKPDLVAVMLPRSTVVSYAITGAVMEHDESRVVAACKRALRPEPPTMATMVNMKNGQECHAERQRVFKWAKHVLENGWEPNQ